MTAGASDPGGIAREVAREVARQAKDRILDAVARDPGVSEAALTRISRAAAMVAHFHSSWPLGGAPAHEQAEVDVAWAVLKRYESIANLVARDMATLIVAEVARGAARVAAAVGQAYLNGMGIPVKIPFPA